MFPQLFGKYVLEREIAAGGMARVYLATLRGAVGFEKRLVVKQIRPELAVDQAFVRRFVEEAKTAVELSHPNIVPVYELGVEQGVYYIAMELCVGVTLSEMLAFSGKLGPEEGAYVGVEICRALDYAYRRAGIVHRDVTPRNVLIDEEGAVRLIDFGIAAPAAGNERGPSEVFGSPGHMPPEQVAGKPLSPSADVFAVAVLLYEAWTGHPAFRRSTAKESFAALKQPVAPIDENEPALGPLVGLLQRGLALDPETRPAQAELFSRPLRDFLRNVDAGDVSRRLGERARRTLGHAGRRETLASAAPRAGSAKRDSDSGSTSTSQIGSATFAAREEVTEWTRQLEPSTRALPPSERPSAAPAARSTPKSTYEPSTRKLPSIPPSARSGEAQGEGEKPGSSVILKSALSSPQRILRGQALLAAFMLIAVALGASAIFQSKSEVRAGPEAAERSAATQPLSQRKALSPNLTAVEPALAPSSFLRAEALATAGLPTRVAASALAAAPERPLRQNANHTALFVKAMQPTAGAASTSEMGLLRLTADLPATVSVQGAFGVRTFSTPVRELRLPPGQYSIVFRSSTYGSPVITQLTLEPSTERGVHVDFREAEPRVSLR